MSVRARSDDAAGYRLGTASAGYFESIGTVAWLMTKSAEYAQFPLACISAWVEPAILHGQIRFLYAEDGKPSGYFAWALLSEETERRLLSDPEVLLHISEWNEGNRLWILDMIAIGGDIRSCMHSIRHFFGPNAIARSLRRSEDGVVRKVTNWAPRHG